MNDKTPSGLPSGLQAESPNQEKFASRLRLKREEAGLTQQDLATKIGVSLTSIQNYEAGRIPRGEHLVALSRELSCSIDWILTGSASLSTAQGSQEPSSHQ
jgi:transcriptional regulator with XRE-family HTH domain